MLLTVSSDALEVIGLIVGVAMLRMRRFAYQPPMHAGLIPFSVAYFAADSSTILRIRARSPLIQSEADFHC